MYGNKKDYNFISYEIDNLPEGFQTIGDFNMDENEILNLGSINLIEKEDSIQNLQEFNREEKLLEKIRYQNLPENSKPMIKGLVLNNKDIFWLEGDSLGSCNVEQREINLTDDKPVYVKQFPLPHKLKDIAIEETQKLITNDLVRTSKSAFNGPAWIVAKKQLADGKKRWRLVIDYRKLNEKTVPDPYLLPNITEIFDKLGKTKFYHVIDLKSGFSPNSYETK